ncbi:MAG TPA: hypothetical protein VGZ25_00645 [Gemmataceae bacterium]|nr:hypothetical protein [Gemmataceae bacterium]
MAPNDKSESAQVAGFIGIGLDNKDGHKRISQSEHFLLVGGSAETHERMQDTAIRFGEALRRRGKRLQDTSIKESMELFIEVHES